MTLREVSCATIWEKGGKWARTSPTRGTAPYVSITRSSCWWSCSSHPGPSFATPFWGQDGPAPAGDEARDRGGAARQWETFDDRGPIWKYVMELPQFIPAPSQHWALQSASCSAPTLLYWMALPSPSPGCKAGIGLLPALRKKSRPAQGRNWSCPSLGVRKQPVSGNLMEWLRLDIQKWA